MNGTCDERRCRQVATVDAEVTVTLLDGSVIPKRLEYCEAHASALLDAIADESVVEPYHKRSNRRAWFLTAHPSEVIEAYAEDGSLHESIAREIESLEAAVEARAVDPAGELAKRDPSTREENALSVLQDVDGSGIEQVPQEKS